jgi:hypothetical protein
MTTLYVQKSVESLILEGVSGAALSRSSWFWGAWVLALRSDVLLLYS